MSGANASPTGRSHQDMSGANASPTGRSHQDMSGANASPTGRSHQEKMTTGAKAMKKSSIALIAGIVTLATGLVFGQGQAYSPLGIDLTGYWVQLGRQQDAGLGTAAGDLVDFGGVPVSAAGRLKALA